MDDGIRLLTSNDLFNCLKANKVGDFGLLERFGDPYILISFRDVKWWQIFRKKRIKKAIDFINTHKPAGIKIDYKDKIF